MAFPKIKPDDSASTLTGMFFDQATVNLSSAESQKFLKNWKQRADSSKSDDDPIRAHFESIQSIFTCSPLESFRSESEKENPLSPASGMAFLPSGDLVVADDFNHRIQIYQSDGTLKHTFGSKGKNEGEFQYPKGVTVDDAGLLYVADCWNHRVQKFDAEGNFLQSFGSHGSGPGQLNEPYDVLVEPDGRLIIIERYNHRIQFFDPEGHSLGSFGSRATVLEERLAFLYETALDHLPRPVFEFPTSIARDSRGNFYISDSGNHRIVKFDPQWKVICNFGERGEAPGQYNYPMSVSVGPNDLLFIADMNNDRIQVCTTEGLFLFAIKQAGDTPLKMPGVLLTDTNGCLHTALTFNQEIIRLQMHTDSLENTYAKLHDLLPDSALPLYCLGRYANDTGAPEKATELYQKALHHKNASKENKKPALPDEAGLTEDLPHRLLDALGDTGLTPEHEQGFEQSLFALTQRVKEAQHNLLALYEEWNPLVENLTTGEIAQKNKILEHKNDPLAFDQELYQTKKKDKELFKQSRSLMFEYRTSFLLKSRLINTLLGHTISPDLLAHCLTHIQEDYVRIGSVLKHLVDQKEENESALVQALQTIQEDKSQWTTFEIKSALNAKLTELHRQLLIELHTQVRLMVTLSQRFSGQAGVRSTLEKILITAPNKTLLPSLVTGLQEDIELAFQLDSSLKNLVDAWLKQNPDPEAVQTLPQEFWSPFPFDTESMNSSDLLWTLCIENTPVISDGNTRIIGNKQIPVSVVDSAGNSAVEALQKIFDYATTYAQKTEELYAQIKGLLAQKPKLESQIKYVDVRDKATPIQVGNNVALLEFQIKLSYRMLLTLEINEMNNLYRLVAGCALVQASSFATDKGFIQLKQDIAKQAQSIDDHLHSLAAQWKAAGLKKAELDAQLMAYTQQIDATKVSQADDLRAQISEINFDYFHHQMETHRQSRLKRGLDQIITACDVPHPADSIAKLDLTHTHSFGLKGEGVGNLLVAYGVAVSSKGDVLVADKGRHHVLRFSADGVFLGEFGGIGNSPGRLRAPYGIVQDADDRVYVVDHGNRRVQKFDLDGKHLLTFGASGDAAQQLGSCFCCSIDSQMRLWVADTEHHRIQVYDPSGQHVKTFGKEGNSAEDLLHPVSIHCLDDGSVLVGDRSDHVLKQFDSEGQLLNTLPSGILTVGETYSMASHPRHGIFVADTYHSQVVQLDASLKPVALFRQPGKRWGQIGRLGEIAVSGDRLYVAEIDNHRVQAFDINPSG